MSTENAATRLTTPASQAIIDSVAMPTTRNTTLDTSNRATAGSCRLGTRVSSGVRSPTAGAGREGTHRISTIWRSRWTRRAVLMQSSPCLLGAVGGAVVGGGAVGAGAVGRGAVGAGAAAPARGVQRTWASSIQRYFSRPSSASMAASCATVSDNSSSASEAWNNSATGSMRSTSSTAASRSVTHRTTTVG